MGNAKPTRTRIWLRELRAVWLRGFGKFLRRIWVLALIVLLSLSAILLQHGQDRSLLHKIIFDNAAVNDLARFASKYGDWPGWATVGFAVWIFGAAKKSRRWRKAGLACLLATLMAGVTINCFRPTMGRPRPYTEIPDGLYGPHFGDTKYHAFMSGHTAASFAAATALVIVAPPVGIPALGGAAVVGWSRLQLAKHNPTDVLTGAATGIFCGWCFGSYVTRRRSAARNVRR
jgi:undecaprenyl-diphosphatase